MFNYLFIFILVVIHVESKCTVPPENDDPAPSNVNKTDAKARLDKAKIALSGKFIYQLSQSKPDENFVSSAVSMMFPLAQAGYFSVDLVLQQLLQIQNLRSKDEIASVYPDEVASYKDQTEVTFQSASRYYFGDDYPLTDNFIEVSEDIFDADGENVNFADSQQAADTINDWVSNQTHGKINDLVSADSLDASTVLVLVNAIYFLGNWVHQFNPNNTEKRDFTKRNNDVIQLDTMYQENYFKYADIPDLNLQALEMPYKGYNFSCLIILPEQDSYDDTVNSLQDPDVFLNVYNQLRSEKVQVYLPKMKINTDIDMVDILKQVGVTAMFDRNSDGFRGIVENDPPLFVSGARQKAFIEVNENGTEATAASAITVGTTAAMEPPEVYVFDADSPYLFYILFQGVPMFCGSFTGAL